jgi:hypothetical protein
MNDIPVVRVRKQKENPDLFEFIDKCPYCGKKHIHGSNCAGASNCELQDRWKRIYLRRGERMKISILLKIIFFTILWHIILVFIEICNFVIPGKCSNCWMKWKFFRKTIIQENDEPRPICRSCIKKFKDTNLWDDLHGPQKYDPQYSNEVENESSKLI